MDEEAALRSQIAKVQAEREEAEMLLREIEALEAERDTLVASVQYLEETVGASFIPKTSDHDDVVVGPGTVENRSTDSSAASTNDQVYANSSDTAKTIQNPLDGSSASSVPSYRGIRDVLAGITEHGRVMEFCSRESTVRRAGV